jgi:DNA polymerase III delta prime subunit
MEETKRRIETTLVEKLNLADFQNAVPIIRELSVMNDEDQPVHALELSVQSTPAFLKPKSWHIDEIDAEGRYHLTDLDVQLDGTLLTRLTEAEQATVTFVLRRSAEASEQLAHLECTVELLPRNQWGGVSHQPDLVAAFVQPNEPAVERLLKHAAEMLRNNGKHPALDGYNGGAKRAWELTSAIWSAAAAMGLDYALPPASFEHTGQKVRGPAQIAESGLATCLDLALLFCAAIEQAGLNPLLVFTKGHAFAGVWLKPEEFSTSVVDDVTALRKRIKLKELALFETTLITQRPAPLFSYAVQRGSKQIAEDQQESFELAVDIRRARLQRIKPLASADAPATTAPAETLQIAVPPLEEAPDLPDDAIVAEPDPAKLNPGDRLERWRRKLLDLSLRNNLLHFKGGKKSLKLEAPEPSELEDLLSAGQALKLMPRPDLMNGADPRNQAIYENREHEDLRREHALDALKRREVFVGIAAEELEARMVELYRAARNTLQESGANTLFLALGFLSWTRDDRAGQRYRAPLILVPVSLDRKSVRSGFTLTLHDDEPRFNPTLIEMLRQDFKLNLGITDGELPKDDAGLDVAAIWKAVSHAVKDIKGWEVTEDVVLATFSFAKYLMWKDLTERIGQLRENPVVRHLIDTPREPYPSGVAFPNPDRLDHEFAPEQIFCPLPADSSQLSAVMAAARGKDFVLIGPPGTGKSQTISNLIAQCLAEGKKVLFVSEKIAALDVVYRRLRETGLGDFCLELHSSKARKLDVLAQLQKSWEARGELDQETWRTEVSRLKRLRDELNVYVERLHFRHANGITLYDAIGQVVVGKDVPVLPLAWHSPDAHDRIAMDALRETVERLEVNVRALETEALSCHPLAAIAHNDWSPSWQQTVIETARRIDPLAQAVTQSHQQFAQVAGLPPVALNQRARNAVSVLARVLPEAAGRDWRFVLRIDARTIAGRLQTGIALLAQHRALQAAFTHALQQAYEPPDRIDDESVRLGVESLAEIRQALQQLSVNYGATVEQFDLPQLHTRWIKAEKSIWPLSCIGKRKVLKQLRPAVVGEGKPDFAQDIPLLDRIATLRQQGISRIEQQLADYADLQETTTGLWMGLKTRSDEVLQALRFQTAIAGAIAHLADTPEQIVALKAPLQSLIGEGNALLDADGPVALAGADYLRACAALQPVIDSLTSAGRFSDTATGSDFGNLAPEELRAGCNAIVHAENRLHAWCAWRKVRDEAVSLGLSPLVTGIEDGSVAGDGIRPAFETNYCRWWLNATVDREPVIRGFVSAEHEKRIADFRALDDRYTALTRDWVSARLCAELPTQEGVARNSEWGILRHEMSKKKRHMPLRELIARIPTALTRLTPCLLMSPLSIAQYLAAEATAFDVVVFDEASQIPVWDAVGAIARGKQVVMVGDPKQLPPTSFFDRAESDLDDEDVEGDLESILDECLGANLPAMNLAWHYRSRNESLIAFSNHRYYEGSLVTFPSPVTEDRAVSFHYVTGVYEKGGARINKPEAQALVADLVARLKSPGFRQSKLTIGVVTFNSEQQTLLENLLDDERRKDPSIEPYFAEVELEPVFVKNLESVQGDERDIMYFSITYGPDPHGAVSMNFGPMNRSGGERRLNVAITRARHELRVFSSLKAEQMDLARTQAAGVRDLKHFLEFAERGPRALAEATHGSRDQFANPFEAAVASALAGKGWELHTRIGASAFRIDLAVVHPDMPGAYLTGIECDGATYHRSATARDRDKLREQVLRGLGWEILRVWSTNWWIDPEGALKKLDTGLQALLETSRARRAEEAAREAMRQAEAALAEAEATERSADTVMDEIYARNAAETPQSAASAVFVEADPTAAVERVDPEAFYDAAYEPTLTRMIAHVVEIEGPVLDAVLARRIARAHGWQRTGSRIQERVDALASLAHRMSQEDVGTFYWPADKSPDTQIAFRRAADESARTVNEISMPELVALAQEVMAGGKSGEDVIVAMARELGLKRLGAASRGRFDCAMRQVASLEGKAYEAE